MVIFAVPDFVKKRKGSGSWKDYMACVLLLSELQRTFQIIEFGDNDYREIIKKCTKDIKHIIISYSWYPELISAVRAVAPWIKIHVRAHNAEAFQHIHRSELKLSFNYNNLRIIYGAFRLAWRDMKCRRQADTLLGISDWDNKYYWCFMPGRAAVEYLPHFSPWPYLEYDNRPPPWRNREKKIVCMPGARDPISNAMIYNFNQLSRHLEAAGLDTSYSFLLTRGVIHLEKQVELAENIEQLESLDDPYALLCRVRAVAVTTPLGFGMKTTILDGIAAGCHVIVHSRLYLRLPESIRKRCIVFNPDDRFSINGVIDKINKPPDHLNDRFNDWLRKEGLKLLDRILT